MFENTRIKLTLIYVGIIMIISGFFSGLLYFPTAAHLDRGFRGAQMLYRAEKMNIELPQEMIDKFETEHPELQEMPPKPLFQNTLQDAKKGLQIKLIQINILILFLSAILSYYFAGKALEPIGEAMEEQKRFIADASHQLRTPLTALKTSLEVEIRDKKTPFKERKILKDNLGEINKLINLTNQLISSIKEPNFSQVNPSKLIKKTLKQVQPLALQKKIKISFKKTSPKLTIKADEQLIEKMLTIFLDNAIKYSPENSRVEIFLSQRAGNLLLRIKDNGGGVSAGDLPHIFDRFYQGKNGGDGFGLGLSIAKKIIDQHHGSITARNLPWKEKKGLVFNIKLPAGV